MARIAREVKNEIIEIERMLKKIDEFLIKAPAGCLKLQKRKGQTYYFHQYKEELGEEHKVVFANDTLNRTEADMNKLNITKSNINMSNINKASKKWKREYIRRESNLAEVLAQKQYYTAVKPILESKLCSLKAFLKDYQRQNAGDVFESLSLERKAMVVPLQVSVNEHIRRWNEEKYEKNNKYPEKLRYETEQGDLVRSKSEVIIANILYKRKRDILYKYERPLTIKIDGKEITIYPDFTILNVHTGKIVYWEHAGRMDDPYYASEFVKKINGYTANGLLPGRDVILTFETQGNAIDIAQVRQWADSLVCL